MTTISEAPSSPSTSDRADVRGALAAEWVKFRTVRGWLVAGAVAVALCALFTFFVANGNHSGTCTGSGVCTVGHLFVPTGPDGEAVADSFEYLDLPVSGNGVFTARVTSLTGLISTLPPDEAPSITATEPGLTAWAKAGILLTSSTAQGSSYAAVMATGAHGVHFQDDYLHDRAGLPGAVSGSSPVWIRLARRGTTVTAYDSTDGAAWYQIGTARLGKLLTTVRIGLFATSPLDYQGTFDGAPTRATARFDDVTLDGHAVTSGWAKDSIGGNDYYPELGTGRAEVSGNAIVVSGSGDIAPAVNISPLGGNSAAGTILFGIVVALIMLIVVATMFVTSEYRRGLIRTTFAAVPRRGAVLAAKAVVAGSVAFAVGAVAAAISLPLGVHALDAGGNYVFPATTIDVVKVVAGAGALLAVTAMGVVGLGAIFRSGAAAITAGLIVFLLPNVLGPGVLGSGGSGGAVIWLYRLTPAAAFSVFGTIPRSSLVSVPYTLDNGYYPLAWWAGLAVALAYAALALGAGAFLLQRRDP